MMCSSVKRQSTDYIDGRLRASERSRVEAHLRECEECTLEIDQLASVRSGLRELAHPVPPAGLRTKLRVQASRERQALMESNWSILQRVWNRWMFRLDQAMRPITLPATGGLLASMILFAGLANMISTTTRGVTYEVPVVYADHTDPNLVPVELRSAVVLTLTLDSTGRIRDYAVQDGSATFVGDPTRLQSDNISMPEFPGVLALAQPTNRDISISFIPILFRH